MTSRLFQALGVVFVVMLVAGSIGGFVVLKDRVRVVVAADDVVTGPDPTALLRDDVQTLARDVATLQQALGANFERLADALEQRADTRHGDVRALRQELAAMRPAHTALHEQVAAMHAQLQAELRGLTAVLAANAGRAEAHEPSSTAALPAVDAPAAPEREPDPPATEAVVAPAPAASGPAAAAPPTGTTGFLSFSVPTTAFRFDAPQDYTLVPELCRVGFDAKSTLHDFSGVTSRVRGSFHADFDDPGGAWTGVVAARAATLVTGVDGRDANLREHLATDEHAEISFAVERFEPAPDGIDVAKATARGDVIGTMTIRGRSRPFRMPIVVEVDPQKRVVLTGQAPLKLSDYGVPVPSQLGVINMQDEVVVWIALRARAASAGRK